MRCKVCSFFRIKKHSHSSCFKGLLAILTCLGLVFVILFTSDQFSLNGSFFTRRRFRNYDYTKNPGSGVCASPTKLILVIVVASSPDQSDRRNAIRETWGSLDGYYENYYVRILFLLGTSKNESIQKAVINEAGIYSDIIQVDFVDTSYDLTTKSVMILKWEIIFCPGTEFVLKTEEDTFVNIANLLNYLKSLRYESRVLFGNKVNMVTYNRLTSREQSLSYLSGAAYVMSLDVAHHLYLESLYRPFFRAEDVFITGVCAQGANIKRSHHDGIFTASQPSGRPISTIIAVDNLTSSQLRMVWTHLQHDDKWPRLSTI